MIDNDKCIKCDGKGTWEVIDKDEWDEISKEHLNSFPGARVFKSCSHCNETGKESIRLTWKNDRLDPTKHEFQIWCDETTPCWHCGELKEKHI
jgi:hypothetical protein